jgi:hypothetical protein
VILLASAVHKCAPGDHLCNSGNAGLGIAVVIVIILVIVNRRK